MVITVAIIAMVGGILLCGIEAKCGMIGYGGIHTEMEWAGLIAGVTTVGAVIVGIALMVGIIGMVGEMGMDIMHGTKFMVDNRMYHIIQVEEDLQQQQQVEWL